MMCFVVAWVLINVYQAHDVFNASVPAFGGVQELGALAEALTDRLQQLWPSALTQETAEDTSVLELRVPPILQLREGRICLVHILAGDRITIADRVLQDADRLAVFVLKDRVGGQKDAAVLW